MGVSSVEALSRILIKNGSKRVLKDLKGRQPSYYFMNKADVLRLKEEEDEDEWIYLFFFSIFIQNILFKLKYYCELDLKSKFKKLSAVWFVVKKVSILYCFKINVVKK